MAASFEKPRDVVGGLVVVGIGSLFLLFGRELEVGSSFRMGPGYFPAILSWLMVALGAVMAGLAWRAPHQEGVFGVVPWRALVLVAGATLFFGLTLARAGPAAGAAGGGVRHRLGQPLRQPQGLDRPGPGHRPVLLGPVHQGAGPAFAADRPLALQRLLVAGARPRRGARARRPGPVRKPARWNSWTIWAWASPRHSRPGTCSTPSSAACSAPPWACCRAWGPWRPSPCSCRSPSRCRRSRP